MSTCWVNKFSIQSDTTPNQGGFGITRRCFGLGGMALEFVEWRPGTQFVEQFCMRKIALHECLECRCWIILLEEPSLWVKKQKTNKKPPQFTAGLIVTSGHYLMVIAWGSILYCGWDPVVLGQRKIKQNWSVSRFLGDFIVYQIYSMP